MNKLFAHFENQSTWLKLIVCVLFTIFLGAADYATGDLFLMIFYLIPIFLATWFIGKAAGQYISFLCVVSLFICNFFLRPVESLWPTVIFWNLVIQGFFLLFSGYLLFILKSELEEKKLRAYELEAVNKELDAFSYTVSHDLKNPLNVINGFSYILLESCSGNLDEQSRGYVREISDATKRMNNLIDSLIKFSLIKHCELNRQTICLSDMARTVEVGLRQSDPERRCMISIAGGITAHGDQQMLMVVLENLLGNAWKYTGEQKEGIIEFGSMIIEGNQTYFVRDNGIGFNMADAEKLFIPFQRLCGTSEYKGHGIGLATVKRIIMRHGGKLWAEGEPGKGAIFYFTLPE
jgi:light-regulated signal transduction histidine kinase (bacteriophytochrome)